MDNNGEIIIYQSDDGLTRIQVDLHDGSVWLTANQMAQLFEKDETNIRKHINNVFSEGELVKENNTQKLRVVGVKQPVAFYNKVSGGNAFPGGSGILRNHSGNGEASQEKIKRINSDLWG